MTVLRFELGDLKNKTKLTKEQIIDTLVKMGFPNEMEDNKIVIEVTPNRPDMFFFEGVVRAINRYNSPNNSSNPKKYIFGTKVGIKNFGVKQRPFIAAAIVKDVSITDNQLVYLMNAQEKMHETIGRKRRKIAIGIHDAKTIKLPIEYTEVKGEYTFIPLGHNQEMGLNDVLTKHDKGRTYAHIIKKPYFPIVMDKVGIISLPPIINAERTRLSPGKRDILIEVTGTHKETVEGVLNIIASTFYDIGGKVTVLTEKNEGKMKEHTKKLSNEFLTFFKKISGLELKKDEVKHLLEKMNYHIDGDNIVIPPYRIDVMHDIDIVEDILIAYGYNEITPELPKLFTEGKKNEFIDKLHDIMKSMRFLETKSNILTDKDYLKKLGMKGSLTIKNPANNEFNTIRPSIIPSIIRSVYVSRMRKKPIRYYEIDHIYNDINNKESVSLAFSLYDKNININDIKSYLQTLMKELGVEFKLKNSNYEYFDKEEQGDIIIKNTMMKANTKTENKKIESKKIGSIGLISNKIKKEILKNKENNLVICEILNIYDLKPQNPRGE